MAGDGSASEAAAEKVIAFEYSLSLITTNKVKENNALFVGLIVNCEHLRVHTGLT